MGGALALLVVTGVVFVLGHFPPVRHLLFAMTEHSTVVVGPHRVRMSGLWYPTSRRADGTSVTMVRYESPARPIVSGVMTLDMVSLPLKDAARRGFLEKEYPWGHAFVAGGSLANYVLGTDVGSTWVAVARDSGVVMFMDSPSHLEDIASID